MKPKVLFVDDEPQVLETLSQLFEADYDVYTALGGEAALAVLEQQPDLAVVVSDQRMPGIKGVEVLAAARQRVPNATRILLTGFADADAAMDSVNMGEVFRYIKKTMEDQRTRRSHALGSSGALQLECTASSCTSGQIRQPQETDDHITTS